MSENEIEYSIVIPVYRSGEWMDELVARIGAVLDRLAPARAELILVNDCSQDAVTWPAIQRNAAKFPWVRGFDLLYNVGQFRATMCGLAMARGQFILTMDDDLQHPPEEIPKLIQALREDESALCVMGRYDTKRHNAFRNAGSRLYQRIMNMAYGKPAGLSTSSFRILRRPLVEAVLAYRTAKPQMSPLIVSLTRQIRNVPVQHCPRQTGRSGYTLWSLIRTTTDSIINASTVPLRLFSVLGFVCAGGSVAIAVFYLIRWIMGGVGVAGFTSQILLTAFLGGMMLAGIGVLGEYVARIISELTGPERYRIRERTGNDAPGATGLAGAPGPDHP